MRYATYLNNVKCMEWELNATQGILFSLLYEAGSWAKEEIIDNKIYYFVSRNVVLKELPMFFEKADTVYRVLKVLHEKGIIEYLKKGKKDLIRLTEKGKEWNEIHLKENSEKNPYDNQNSEKNPSNSEKNPNNFGKKSEKEPKNSENFPTNNNTNIYNNTNNNITNYNSVYTNIQNLWNDEAQKNGISKIITLSDTRKRKLQKLIKNYGFETIKQNILKIKESEFLLGNNKNGWTMTFDDFIEERKFLKLLEDGYKKNLGGNNNANNGRNGKAKDNKTTNKQRKPNYDLEF